LRIVLSKIVYAEAVFGVVLIAWCTDASSESRKMRKLLNWERPWLITIDCWCHQVSATPNPGFIDIYLRQSQVNLILGDIFKRKYGPLVGVLEKAQQVVRWFTHHSRRLGILREV
jgi:hypothetical protein